MPSVVSDPSLQPGIVNQNSSLGDYPDSPVQSLMALQGNPAQPLADRTATATGLLFPDLLLQQRLANFPGEVWDLTPSSYLWRFMFALMGPAGAGQLRSRQQFARLATAVAGTHFYDLDAFYGAIFGATRNDAAALPVNPATGTTFNPYTDVATQDGWDEIGSLDAVYRERVIQLARAITLGGTVPGMQALAEAVLSCTCEVYETWKLIDWQGPEGSDGNTWATIEADYAAWSAFGTLVWSDLGGGVNYGGMGISARSEIIIMPQKTYSGSIADQQQAASDAQAVMAVARTLAPSSAIVSVNTTGSLADQEVGIAAVTSDSDYWEVIAKVQVPSAADPLYQNYINAYDRGGQRADLATSLQAGTAAFTQSQGTQYSYTASASAVFSSSWEPKTSPVAVLEAPKTNSNDYQTVVFPGGKPVSWVPAWGIADPAVATAGRVSSPVSAAAAPYSGPRAPVTTAG